MEVADGGPVGGYSQVPSPPVAGLKPDKHVEATVRLLRTGVRLPAAPPFFSSVGQQNRRAESGRDEHR